MTPDLSVVLPCYRSAPLARRSVQELAAFLDSRPGQWEIVVVDDGGGDFRDDEWDGEQRVRLVRLPVNRGKGAAVAAGMLAARGSARVFTDVDLPYDLELIPVIAHYLLARRFHLVIGDRTLPESSYRLDIPLARRIASAAFTTFVGRVVTGGFFDTQCGLKGARADVAEAIFPLLTVERFAFDVELVYAALINRIDIKRVPVRLRRNETSSVRVGRDSARMLVDVLSIKAQRMRGRYASAELERIVYADHLAACAGAGHPIPVVRHNAAGQHADAGR